MASNFEVVKSVLGEIAHSLVGATGVALHRSATRAFLALEFVNGLEFEQSDLIPLASFLRKMAKKVELFYPTVSNHAIAAAERKERLAGEIADSLPNADLREQERNPKEGAGGHRLEMPDEFASGEVANVDAG